MNDQPVLGLTHRADDAAVARVARRFAAAKIAEEEAQCGPSWLQAQVDLDAALADLLLVCGYADPYEGTEHDDRPEDIVRPTRPVL